MKGSSPVSGKGKVAIIAGFAAVILTLAGLYRLVELRFDSGDVFPASSSLRSDPMGCKALFQALGRCDVVAERNYRELRMLKGEQGTTLYWLGADETLLEKAGEQQAKSLQSLAVQGDRVVIAFDGGKRKSPAGVARGDAAGKTRTADAASTAGAGAAGAWGVDIVAIEAPPASGTIPAASLSDGALDLPRAIPLRASRYFRRTAPWRAVYSYNNEPVVLERTMGKGSMVLLVDPYLFSNEAMRNDRHAGLISWLQGANHSALFDEAHLGVYDTPGMMTLIRKHRLIPILLALLALAALQVWKSAIPFAAVSQLEEVNPEGEKRDHFSGLVNLLRRNIAPHEVMSTCFKEWRHSFSGELKNLPELAGELQKVLDEEQAGPAAKRDPVALYRRMTELLAFFRIK
jgi:hypothetical protein